MLKLKKLTLNGIGRFVETQTIDFKSLGHLVQLGGLNKNTGGSSGAGKTTVFNSLDYLFGLNATPNSALQSRLTKDTMTVSAEFDWDGKDVEVTRGKKLSVTIGGEVVSGSNKLAEEALDSLMGMSRDLFRKILHKRQKEGGFFLQFTPKETHEFMADALGIGNVLTKVESVDKIIKTLSDKVATLQMGKHGAEQALASTRTALQAIGSPPVREVTPEQVAVLKAEIDRVATVLEPLKQAQRLDLAGLELIRPKGVVIPYDYTKQNELRALEAAANKELNVLLDQERARKTALNQQINDLRVQRVRLETIAKRGVQALSEAQQLGLQIQTIQGCKCPTCEQSWANQAAKDKEASLKLQAASNAQEYMSGIEAQKAIVAVLHQIEGLEKQLDNRYEGTAEANAKIQGIVEQILQDKMLEQQWTRSQNEKNQAEHFLFQTKQKNLQEAHAAQLVTINEQAAKAVREYDMAAMKSQNFEKDSAQYAVLLKNMQANELKQTQLIAQGDLELAAATHSLVVAEEAKKVLKSFASCAFDDALEEVSEMATRLVRAIPTMATATISLEGTRETKEGKVKEEVNAVISMDGDQNIAIKTLSGGERSSVDLAIDLAVIDLLENKTNKGIDVFVLDEPFTGLDTVGIEMALEVLKGSNSAKRLVIVDHNPEVKQMVESKLLVVRDGLTSSIVQN